MPKLLSNFITSSALIGFIMTIDNYLALFIQPAVGMYNDRINTRFGKRMPFLMVGMPLAAIFAAMLPNNRGFISILVFLILMNLSMSIFRSPVIALMPDITHKQNRSKANRNNWHKTWQAKNHSDRNCRRNSRFFNRSFSPLNNSYQNCVFAIRFFLGTD